MPLKLDIYREDIRHSPINVDWLETFWELIRSLPVIPTYDDFYYVLTALSSLGLKPHHLYEDLEEGVPNPTAFLCYPSKFGMDILVALSKFWKCARHLARWMVEQDMPLVLPNNIGDPVSHRLLHLHGHKHLDLLIYFVRHKKVDLEEKDADGKSCFEVAHSLHLDLWPAIFSGNPSLQS